MAERTVNGTWSVVITGEQWALLYGHLFPGDGDEHGAILRCGIARSSRGTRLLVHDVVTAVDGIDYIEGNRGYRKLTARFVADNIDTCAEEGLAYLAVHNHGGRDRVGFSRTDVASHERGYPALLDINDGVPVGLWCSRAMLSLAISGPARESSHHHTPARCRTAPADPHPRTGTCPSGGPDVRPSGPHLR